MKKTYLVLPNEKDMMVARLNQPNILMNVEETFNSLLSDSSYEEDSLKVCVNPGKHVKCMMFSDVKQLETHVKACFDFNGKLCLKGKKGEKRVVIN